MGILDGIIGQLGSNLDIGAIAANVGIDPATAEKAIAALGIAHGEPGDTLDGGSGADPFGAAATGLPPGWVAASDSRVGSPPCMRACRASAKRMSRAW